MMNHLRFGIFLVAMIGHGQVLATDSDDTQTAIPESPADQVLGLWATDKAEAHVEIYKTDDGVYNGRIVWLKEPFYPADDWMGGEPRVDRENPDPALRDRPIEGLEIIHGFRFDGDDRWVDGEIYDPENGSTYSSKMWITEDGSLKVRGYVGISLFGRTTEWTPVLGGSHADPVDADVPAEGANDSGDDSDADATVQEEDRPVVQNDDGEAAADE